MEMGLEEAGIDIHFGQPITSDLRISSPGRFVTQL
jgi:hypothetical protein